MPYYDYPGVYVEEVPSGVRTIANVSTSDTAFVDWFPRGPDEVATRITSYAEFERTFGGLNVNCEAGYQLRQYFLNGGSVAWVVRVLADGAAAASVTVNDSAQAPALALTVRAKNKGAWGNDLRIAIKANGSAGTYDMMVRLYRGDDVIQSEVYRGLSPDPLKKTYADVMVNAASELVNVDTPDNANLPAETDAAAVEDQTKAQTTALATGADGAKPGDQGWAAVAPTTLQKGFAPLRKIAPFVFNMLSVPAAAKLDATAAGTVYANALKLCLDERAMLIVDIPDSLDDLAELTAWGALAQVRDKNAALYFPTVSVVDPLNANRPRKIGTSGTVAGIWARTDATRGVWKAPAGTDAKIRGATLDAALTDKESGAFNILGLNVLRTFPIYGNVVWGARTLAGADAEASEWKYIPVRRTALMIEEALYQGLKWVVFEPNDEPLWAQIRLNVGAYLQTLFRQGAFAGTSAREAYFVRCDRSTTTATDVNMGVVNIHVGFAPLKPAEFVVVRIQQIAGQAES